MKEYVLKNAIVRIHGTYNQEQLKKACEEFIRKVVKK